MGIFSDLTDSFLKPLQFGYDVFNTERNYHMQRQQWQYQKDLNNLQMQREDTAVQRRAADMKAAGFSPYLAAGNAATTGTLSSSAAPQHSGVDLMARWQQSLAMDQAHANISKTNAEADAVRSNNELTKKNIELVTKTIKWYDDHPGYAPGVESGVHTGKGLQSLKEGLWDPISDRLSSVGSRLGSWLYKKGIRFY